jgi:hypothetical protein
VESSSVTESLTSKKRGFWEESGSCDKLMIFRIRRPLEPRARRSDPPPGARISPWPHRHTVMIEDRTVAASLSRLKQVPGGYTSSGPPSVQRLKNPYFLFFSISGYLLRSRERHSLTGLLSSFSQHSGSVGPNRTAFRNAQRNFFTAINMTGDQDKSTSF